MPYRLGVDLGTTFTAAAVDDGSGPTMVGLGNRALQIPSVLFLQQDGTFLVGEAAERRAAVEPDRAVREFKRRLGDTVPILVAGRPFSAQALTARLLGWVIERVVERQGSAPDEVVLTYPANWGGYKRELLDQVVTLADLPGAVTCTEPEAAASQYTTRSRLSPGDQLVVYDLGGGTFDVCVLQKQEVGFRILGSPDGIEHLGGIDFDEAVFGQVLAELGDAAAGLDPADPQVTAGVARLRRECVEAKEALSNDVDAVVPVTLPGLSVSVRVTRTDFEALITPALHDTLAAVRRALRSADTSADRIAAVVLVGGSSRIPLVSHLLQAEFGGRMAMDIHPKHDIALGALRYQPGSQETTPLPASDLPRWPTRDVATGSSPVHDASPTAETPIAANASAADASAVAAADTAATQQVSAADSAQTETALPVSRPPVSSPWWRGRAALIVSAAVLAVLALVAVAGAVVLGGGDDDKKPTNGASTTTPTVTTSAENPVVSQSSVIVPIAVEGAGVDLYVVDENGATELLGGVDDQRFPSVSRDRTLLQYASGTLGNWTQMVLRSDGETDEMFNPPLPSGLDCAGKIAWPRELPGDAAMVCAEGEESPSTTEPAPPIEFVYLAEVDEDGHFDLGSMRQLTGIPEQEVGDVSFTDDGGLVVSIEEGSASGLYYWPPDGSDPSRLTSGRDSDAMVSPEEGDGRVVFARDDDLYLARVDDEEPECASPLQADGVTGRSLCQLTTGGDLDEGPAWSWDGNWIAFVTRASEDELRILKRLEVANPNNVGDFFSTELEGLDIVGEPMWATR